LRLKRLGPARQVLWDVETGNAICGTPTCTDFTVAIKFLNNDGAKLVTCGNYNLNVWQYDHLTNKLVPSDVQLGQLRRCFTCLAVDAADQYMYCGTATGDVLQVCTPFPVSLLPRLGSCLCSRFPHVCCICTAVCQMRYLWHKQ